MKQIRKVAGAMTVMAALLHDACAPKQANQDGSGTPGQEGMSGMSGMSGMGGMEGKK